MLETFRVDTFDIGDKFKVFYGENEYVEIVLVKAEISKYQNPCLNRQAFSLIFTSDKQILIESGTYHMGQDKVGEFDMGISPIIPIGGDVLSHYYEAAFS